MNIDQLKANFPHSGCVEWIGVRSARGAPITVLDAVDAVQDIGLQGDKAGARPGGKRQVTLVQAEYLGIMRALLAKPNLSYMDLRRNLAVSNINLNALIGHSVRIGSAELEVSGLCHPCKKIEENLGFGAFNVMRGHGGLTAKVIKSGVIKINDSLEVIA